MKRNTQTTEVFAVLTGDIIGSTDLSARQIEKARDLLVECVQRFRSKHIKAFRGKPELFRGDAWQLLLAEPRWALRISLLIRAVLRAELHVDTRISIGIGGVDHVKRDRVSLSTGEAFTLSGRALDGITGYFELTGALPDQTGAMAAWLPVVLHLCSGLVHSWTRRQAEIVSHALQLQNPTHESIAAMLTPPVSKQTVTDSLAGANWRILLEPIRAFETTDWSQVIKAKESPMEQTGKKASHKRDRTFRLSTVQNN